MRAGELVGIAGVQGNGQTELVEALVGLRRPESGRVLLDGQDITHHTPRQRHEDGIAHIPEDRQRDGMVKDFTVFENIALTGYYDEPFSSGPVMHWGVVERGRRAASSTSSTSARRRSAPPPARCPAATSRR